MPRYEAVSALRDLMDRINIWIQHEMQPLAYSAPAEDLVELSDRLVKISKEVGPL